MVRNDGVDARKVRMHKVIEAITATLTKAKQNGEKWIPLRKTFAIIEYDTGLTPEKIRVYATVGVERGIYVLDEKDDQIKFAES